MFIITSKFLSKGSYLSLLQLGDKPIVQYPKSYIMVNKVLLSLHHIGYDRPSYICKNHDIQPYISCWLAHYIYKEVSARQNLYF